MKKLLSYIISIVLVIGLGIGVFFIVLNVINKKEHTLTVTAGENGSIVAKIDDEHFTISSNLTKTFKVTRKSKISLAAKPAERYSILTWKQNEEDYSTNPEIEIVVKKDVTYKAIFQENIIDITIVDGENLTETIKFNLTNNLLQTLNDKYTAPKGYEYIYKIGGNVVTETTSITSTTTITRELSIVNRTIKFVLPDGETFADDYTLPEGFTLSEDKTNIYTTYNINSQITNPTAPTYDHYTTSWETYSLDSIKDITVNLIKTKIKYPAKFVLPSEETFTDGTAESDGYYCYEEEPVCNKTVNIEDYFEIKWNFTPTYNSKAELEITGVKQYKTYKTTFILPEGYTFDGTNSTVEITYTYENYTSTVAPTLPTARTGCTIAWDKEFALTAENLGTITEVTAIETKLQFTATFTLPEGLTFTDETTTCDVTYDVDTEKDSIICNKEIAAEHYTVTWADFTLTYNKDEALIINGTKTAKNYKITFKLPEGKTFTESYTLPAGFTMADDKTNISTTYTIETENLSIPSAFVLGNEIITWSATKPENLGDFEVIGTETVIHTINYSFSFGYNISDLKVCYKKIAYVDETLYVLNNNIIVETLTLDNAVNNLYDDNNKDGQSGYLNLVELNGTTVTTKEDFKNKLKTELEKTETQTITIYYEEPEIF